MPLPPKAGGGAEVRRRRRRRRKPWYKRPLIIVPLVLLLILGAFAGGTWYRTMSAFDKVNSVSTPPPEVSGSALGGDEDLVIDTGPAQEILRQQQLAEEGGDPAETTQPTEPGTEVALVQPTAPSTEAAATSTDPTAPATKGTRAGLVIETTTEATVSTATDASIATESVASSTEATTAAPGTTVPGAIEASAVAAGAGTATPALSTLPAGGINILLMGVDAREGESIDIGVRADSLGVLHLDEETGLCRILAVPRDSRVDMPGYGMTKINHALAVGGIPFQQLVVERYLGVEIDHYGLVDFAALTQVVDELGGITVDNPEAFAVGDQQFAAGTIQLDGAQALLYSRYRGGADGDFGRVEKQQQVIKAIMDEVTNANLVRLVPDMFGLLANHIRTDFGITDSLDLANTYRDTCTSVTLETHTIPGDVGMHFDDMMQMDLSFVVSDPVEVRKEVEWLLGVED